MDFPKSEFWNYSTQLWCLPDVESICVDLQNNLDADVNLMLYCCWVGDMSKCLNEDDIQTLLDINKPWHTMIKPLRDSRKMMQQQLIAMPSNIIEQTINNIKEMELNSEHMAQLSIEKALELENITPCADQSSIECCLHNLNAYFQSLDSISASTDFTPQLSQLLTAIFQDEESVQLAFMNQMAAS